MLSWIVVFLLETLHIDSRSEFQWTDASNSVIRLVECVCANSCLSENFHLIGAWASDLLPGWAYLDCRGRFSQLSGILLGILLRRRLLDGLSGSTLLGPLPDHHLWKRLLWGNCFQKFFLINLLIGIQINPSNNRIVVLLASLLSGCVEETLQILLVDVLQVAVVNSLVSRIFAVAFGRLQLLLQVFCVTVHFDLHHDELGQLFLDVKGQVIIPAAHHVRALSSLRTQTAISARQNDLHKVRVVQTTIQIRVEELNEVVTVCFSNVTGETIISNIVQKLFRWQETRLVPIEPLEGRVRFKVLICCQILTLEFNLLLILWHCDEQVS